MANPEHQEPLDLFDKISVICYRTGISLFSLSLAWYCIIGAVEMSWGTLPSTFQFDPSVLFSISAALSAANLHVYDKHIRAIITWSSWVGIVLFATLHSSDYVWVAYGFVFVTFSGIALKESFCFKVFGLKFTPFLLLSITLSMAFGTWAVCFGLMAISALIFSYLALQKWKMPLHFDIGNKANYQI